VADGAGRGFAGRSARSVGDQGRGKAEEHRKALANEMGTMRRRVWRSRGMRVADDMGFLCFVLPETKELELRWKEELLLGFESFPRRYYPDRVRGYFSARNPAEHPVSMIQLKHRRRRKANAARLPGLLPRGGFAGAWAAREPARAAGAASEAIEALERTSIMACCASIQTDARTPRLAGAGPAGDEAEVKTDGAVDGLDDLAHGCAAPRWEM